MTLFDVDPFDEDGVEQKAWKTLAGLLEIASPISAAARFRVSRQLSAAIEHEIVATLRAQFPVATVDNCVSRAQLLSETLSFDACVTAIGQMSQSQGFYGSI